MTVFDGKGKAEEVLVRARDRVRELGVIPKLVSFYLPEDRGSALYTKIKSQKAKEAGIEFVGVPIQSVEKVLQLIKQYAEDTRVTGIMVQHPSGEHAFAKKEWKTLISAIPKEKDVDGLREGSPFLPATVKAILYVLHEAQVDLCCSKFVIVGANGMIGKRLVEVLKENRADVVGADIETENLRLRTKEADVVISATGVPGLIREDMVKAGVVVIDVGAPKGDIDFESVSKKASFITPVPGGIGPMTVASLMENVLESFDLSHAS